jgi:hypothetical protein
VLGVQRGHDRGPVTRIGPFVPRGSRGEQAHDT